MTFWPGLIKRVDAGAPPCAGQKDSCPTGPERGSRGYKHMGGKSDIDIDGRPKMGANADVLVVPRWLSMGGFVVFSGGEVEG